MKINTLLSTASCLVLFTLAVPASAALLGPASNYNVFVFNDFTSMNSDSEGNIAAGGNVNLTNYSVASSITGNTATLLAGGNVTASNGGVGNGQNGTIYATSSNLNSFTANGGVQTGSLFDFSAAETQYQNLSSSWSALASNGNVSTLYGALNLTGSDSSLNIFNVNGSDLTGTGTVNILAPTSSTVLINVSGSAQQFQNGQVFLNGIDSSNVIYNFFESTSLNLVGSKNPQGSILAAWANVIGGYGQLNGQLIAQSFNGNTEFHTNLFDGVIPSTPVSAVPLPASIWLFGSVIGFLGFKRRQKIKTAF